ncbi:1871_t:CDS:10 [Diversispora eburnea]|uniref:1871_t:CDS:1 n=1 Tax=Diversispora eburnea TaxID=1213867 RepID=A0A9N9C0R8_9GLOM|nr:1871_t:CDS:10 [Diversispora eburnea]
MYAQPPPPNPQQSAQRPISNPPQPQSPSTSNAASSLIQQNWRPVGIHNAQAVRPSSPSTVPQNNSRSLIFPPSQRPPQNGAAPGFSRPPIPVSRPTLQGQSPTTIAAIQTPQSNTFSTGFPGSRPHMVPPVYSQPTIPPLSTTSQYATRPLSPPGPMRSPPQGVDIDNMVNQMNNIGIQDQPQLDQHSKPSKQNRPKRAYHPSSNLNNSSNIYPQPPPQYMQPTSVPNQQPQTMPRPVLPNAPRSRIDPNQIPSPVVVQEQDQRIFEEQVYMTCSKSTVPLASTDFRAIDEGISNPRFMRLTLYSIPHTEELLQTSHLPLGVILQPLTKLRDGEGQIELVDLQEQGPVRCLRCKAYINPFVIFVEGGKKFVCNMCSFSNEVPPEYFCILDMNGRRADIDQRPELKYGTVEFTVPQEYWAKPPAPLSYVFAIDVSWNSIKSGMLAKCVETIRDILYNSPNNISRGGKIGIITFDKDIHFYNLQPQLEQAQMLVVSDINDVFVPLNSGLLVDPIESRTVIEGLLESLPTMFVDNKAIDPVLGAVVQATHMALNETGGKLLLFQTALPTFGPGSIKQREDPKIYNTDKERSLFSPQDNYYKTLATNCVDSGICIDLFLFPNTYVDIATIGLLSCLTGGETYYYPNFDAQKDGEKFAYELKHNLTREFGYNALMRIRCSNGLKVTDHFGNFNMRNTTDLELAGIDSDKAFGALLKYDGKLDEKTDAYIQCALLYTTSSGQRRVRTHNLSVTVTQLLGNVFRHAEMDTTVNFLAKQAVSNTITKPLRDIRDHLTDKCVKILMAYRRYCASQSSSGQLILPEAFKLFPLYALTMLKSKALRVGNNLTSDVRVHYMRLIKSVGVSESIVLFYPRLFPVHNLSDQVGHPDQNGRVKLPPLIRVSYARLEHDGAYLLENGQTLIFWLGRQISPDFVRNVFGVDSVEQIDPKIINLPVLENPTSTQIRSIIAYLQSQRPKYLSLKIARMQIDPSELEFNSLLVEDENNNAMSYVDYLCYIHKQIQSEG